MSIFWTLAFPLLLIITVVLFSLLDKPPSDLDYPNHLDDLTLPFCPDCGLELRPRSVPDGGDRVIRLWCDCCRQFPRQPIKPEERR